MKPLQNYIVQSKCHYAKCNDKVWFLVEDSCYMAALKLIFISEDFVGSIIVAIQDTI